MLIIDQSFNSSQTLSFLKFILRIVPSHPNLRNIDVSGSFVDEVHSEVISEIIQELKDYRVSVEGVILIPGIFHYLNSWKEHASSDFKTFAGLANRNPPRILHYNRFRFSYN